MLHETVTRIIEEHEKRKCFARLQSEAEEAGKIPPMPRLLLRRLGRFFQYVGGGFLGIFVGLFAYLLNYIIIVLLLHMGH
jgi:hypothetical protein